jgi:hypothetical protein
MLERLFGRVPTPAPVASPSSTRAQTDHARGLYLALMEKCLINSIYEDPPMGPWQGQGYDAAKREAGVDWPSSAHSMIGAKRMFNLRCLCEYVIVNSVPGDFIETGVWRGGASIMMRAVIKAYEVSDRSIWLADSFAGLPPPDAEKYPADLGDNLHAAPELAISLETVQANFARYDLLDAQVRFLKGWFRDTLHAAPIDRLAILRLDGDMYESTMDALSALYDKVSPGGFVIVDDYFLTNCRQAITDFRANRGIVEPLQEIDGNGVFWEKAA